MTQRDFYEVLGVSKKASLDEIKAAYRRLALYYHPDKNPGDVQAEERFKEVSEAYAILSDRNARIRYDGQLSNPLFGGNYQGGVEDIFSQIFQNVKQRRQSRRKGSDINKTIRVSFEESAHGCQQTVSVHRRENCETCNGSGSRPGGKPQLCQACGGSGKIQVQKGLFQMGRECGYCNGKGHLVDDPCIVCEGKGVIERDVDVMVKVPAGAQSGTVLRYRGEGQVSVHGGAAGDLRITVEVDEHPLFSREGYDVTCVIPVSFTQAALGDLVEVPTLSGRVNMRIPAETQTHRIFRLREKGIIKPDGKTYGDQLVQIVVETPRKLNEEQRELLEQLAGLSNEHVHPQQRTFWDKVKELFD